ASSVVWIVPIFVSSARVWSRSNRLLCRKSASCVPRLVIIAQRNAVSTNMNIVSNVQKPVAVVQKNAEKWLLKNQVNQLYLHPNWSMLYLLADLKHLKQKTRKPSLTGFLNPRQTSRLEETIHTIECRYTVGFRHGRIVKRGFHKILDRIVWTVHHRLTNVDNFRCIITEAMYTQNFQRFTMEQNL